MLNKSLLKSAIQKAVRRGEVEKAIIATKYYIEIKEYQMDFARRLPIIVLEDAILHPEYDKLVEIIKKLSKKDNFLNDKEKQFLIQIIAELSATDTRDDFIWKNKDRNKSCDWSKLEKTERELISAIRYRASIGGMRDDMEVLGEYAKIWGYRFSTGGMKKGDLRKYFPKIKIDYKKIKKLTIDDILLEAVDFHCSPLLNILMKKQKVLQTILSEYPNDTISIEDRLKDIVWRMRSGVCGKKQIGKGRAVDWFKDDKPPRGIDKNKYKKIYSQIQKDIDSVSYWFLKKQFINK